jgi:hypothetical protein
MTAYVCASALRKSQQRGAAHEWSLTTTHLPLLALHTVNTPDNKIRVIFPQESSDMRDLRLVRSDDGDL